MRRLTARSKLRAAQALLLMRSLSLQSSSPQQSGATVLQAIGSSLHDLRRRHMYLYCFAELQETRLLCSEESLSDALGIKLNPNNNGHEKVRVTKGDPRPLVHTWIHDEGALTEAMELSRDVLFAARVTDVSIWKMVLTTLLHHDQGRPLLQTLLNLISDNLLQSVLHEEIELRNQLTAYVTRFVEEEAEKLEQIWDVVRLKVQSSMAESAASQAKLAKTGSVNNNKSDMSISKQEILQRFLPAEGGFSSVQTVGDKGINKEKADKADKEKSSGPTSADINQALSGPGGGVQKARRTLLVERCQASVLGWDEPPEELLLNLSQAAFLWGYFADGTVFTASKEYQSRVGASCQKILSLLCQTFNLPTSSASRGSKEDEKTVRRLTVDEALRQSGLQCMLALIRSSCSGLADLRKLVCAESGVSAAESINISGSHSGSLKVIAPFLESLLLAVVKQSSNNIVGTNTTTTTASDFADKCMWGLFSTCSCYLPKPVTLQVLSSVVLQLQSGPGVEMIARLLRLATTRWTESEDSRRAAVVAFSWCLSFRSKGTNISVDTSTEEEEAVAVTLEGDFDAKNDIEDNDDNTELVTLVRAAISGLHKKDRCSLRMAVESLSSSLGKQSLQQMSFL